MDTSRAGSVRSRKMVASWEGSPKTNGSLRVWLALTTLALILNGVGGRQYYPDEASTGSPPKKDYGGAYVDNRVPYTDLPYRDRCGMISQVQSTVIQILNTHYEYGKGIHMLHSIVEALQGDLSALKTHIHDVEKRISGGNDTATGAHASWSRARADPDAFRASPSLSKSVQSLHWGLRNVTRMMLSQDKQYELLERKYKTLRRKLKKVGSGMPSKKRPEKSDDKLYALEHYTRKQTDINSKLLQRIQALEQRIKIQADSPYINDNHGGCPPDFVRHFTSCYMFVNNTDNWIDAEKHCQRLHPKSHLVAIETREEAEYIVQYRIHNLGHWASRYIWIGGNDMTHENVWRWVGSNRILGYTNWRPGQPDNHNGEQHCVYLRADGADPRWDDWHCYAARLNYVCEINMAA